MASETCLVPPREGLGGSGKRRLRDVQERQVRLIDVGLRQGGALFLFGILQSGTSGDAVLYNPPQTRLPPGDIFGIVSTHECH